ncbi:MAG: ribonuclease D [Micavibrio sp.]|nr:ribonuclease D [Micavibrio sp.]
MTAGSPRYVLYKNDFPDDLTFGDVLAIDSEFMGLNVWRDRLCLLQVYDGVDGKTHMVQFDRGNFDAPNVKKLLSDPKKEKIFYFARGDMRWIGHYLGIILENVYCLKIASRIARTYTQQHELQDVSHHVLGVKISKEQQCTDWGAPDLSHAQLDYACNDVVYLHAMKEKLNAMMVNEGRLDIAYGLFKCLPHVVRADLAGWGNEDLFGYHVPRP